MYFIIFKEAFMLWFKIVTKTVHKFVALFVLLYTCNILLWVALFRASHALKDQFSNS